MADLEDADDNYEDQDSFDYRDDTFEDQDSFDDGFDFTKRKMPSSFSNRGKRRIERRLEWLREEEGEEEREEENARLSSPYIQLVVAGIMLAFIFTSERKEK